MKRWWASTLMAALWAGSVQAQPVVEFASLDAPAGKAVQLKAHWYAAPGPQAPALVLLHGCGGMYNAKGSVSERMRDYATWLNQQGMHALVVDSFTPRGEKEICTQRTGSRAVTMAHRRQDALAALQWLAQRPEVDAQRIGLLGWSNGGSAVLSATNTRHRQVKGFALKPTFAVAFYPGGEAELKRGYAPSAPLLLLVGEADDWTSAASCHRLAEAAVGTKPQIEGYAGAHHGFDSSGPVRLLKNVPNGVNPGQGVHVGGNAEARQRSRERLLQFLQAYRSSPALPQNTR